MSTGEPQVLRVALVGGPMYDPLYDAIPAFEALAGVRVVIAAKLPHPELNAYVADALSSGAPLDVISTHTKYAPSQAQWLSPLDVVVGDAWLDDLLAHPVELSRVDGALLQVPRNLDVRLLHYRRDLVAEAPRTWADLVAAADAGRHAPAGPSYGFLFPGRDSGLFGTFYELLVSAGGELFDEALQPAFDTDAGRWAVEQIVDLHRVRELTPRDLERWHYDEISAAFRDGQAVMVTDWPGSHHLYRNPATSRVAAVTSLALLPEGPAGKRAAYAGCHSFAIPRTARLPTLAAALVAHLTSFEAQRGEARLGAIPCRASALAAIGREAAGDPVAAERWRLLAETEQAMIVPPRFASYPSCEDALWRAVQQAMIGVLSPDVAVRQAAAHVRSIVTAHAATGP
jgi:multiple sugar transport system substrate-binding protein